MELIRKKFNRSVSMLSWAYNEEDSISDFLERATQLMELTVEDYEIILIDDGSTDKTYEIAKKFQEKNPKLKIIRNYKNVDIGISIPRAIQSATKEYIFWQMVDWCYDISNLRTFLEYLKTYDIVQGVRRSPVRVKLKILKPIAIVLKLFGIKHLTRRSDTVKKAIISVINYILIRVLFGVPLSDFQNVIFCSTKWIQSIKYEANSSFVVPEILLKSYWSGKLIKEVPVNFIPRKAGKSKGTRTKAIISAIKDISSLWFKWIILGKRNVIKKGIIYRLAS